MCMNCGCGQLDTRHQPDDIVRDDIQRAADGQGASMEDTVRNLQAALQRVGSDGTRAGQASGTTAAGATSSSGTSR